MSQQTVSSTTVLGTANASDNMESRKKGFESLSRVAVVGASSNDAKPSAKILRYLLSIGKKAIPINPRYKTLQNQDCLPSLQGISEPENTAVSIVVNPKVTLKVLKTAEEIGIPYLWLQPGTTDAAVLSYIRSNPDLEKRCIYDPSSPLRENIVLTGPNCPDTVIPASALASGSGSNKNVALSTDSSSDSDIDIGSVSNPPSIIPVVNAGQASASVSVSSDEINPGPGSNLFRKPTGNAAKRSRELENIDTASVKSIKTGPSSSPMTARSTRVVDSPLSTTSRSNSLSSFIDFGPGQNIDVVKPKVEKRSSSGGSGASDGSSVDDGSGKNAGRVKSKSEKRSTSSSADSFDDGPGGNVDSTKSKSRRRSSLAARGSIDLGPGGNLPLVSPLAKRDTIDLGPGGNPPLVSPLAKRDTINPGPGGNPPLVNPLARDTIDLGPGGNINSVDNSQTSRTSSGSGDYSNTSKGGAPCLLTELKNKVEGLKGKLEHAQDSVMRRLTQVDEIPGLA